MPDKDRSTPKERVEPQVENYGVDTPNISIHSEMPVAQTVPDNYVPPKPKPK